MRNSTLQFLLVFAFSCGVMSNLQAQNIETDEKLQQHLNDLTQGFKGVAGIYVYNLKTHKEAGVNTDTVFPTASIIKVPILTGLFNKIAQGEYKLHDTLLYDEKRAYGGSGLMQFYKDSTKTDLRTLAALMITYSDNTSSLWCQELAGGGKGINRVMENLGLKHTRINSRTEGREDIWKIYGWGQTTPREMAGLLIKMRNRELINQEVSDEMYRMMSNSFYTDYSLSQIPPYVQTAAKQGMVDASRSELVMVNAPGGDYVFYFATKENEDTSWDFNNEAWVLSRNISAFLWNYFEPDSNWEPALGTEELVKGMPY